MRPDTPREDGNRPVRVQFELRSRGAKEAQLKNNPRRSGSHSRGYLPHVKCEGASYFVTFRLNDSLPREVLMRLQRERAQKIRQLSASASSPETRIQIERNLRREIERFLDTGVGECHLRKTEIARLVHQALLHFDNDRYVLGGWVIMPNHVHVIVRPLQNHLLGEILKSWKNFTGREANRILRRTGHTFWQPESFDHWIRNDDEKARIERYIRNNPINAGLCEKPESWPWSSAAQHSTP